jgi:prepilin-type N-terminal cleavage/methylation domain-containing protein
MSPAPVGTPEGAAGRPHPDPQRGFSLVEVIVSMMVLGMLSVSVFYFLTSQNSLGARSGDLLKGLNLGKLAMDSLKVSDYGTLEAGSDTVVARYIRSWRITRGTDAEGRSTGRKTISLTVHWPLTAENNLTFTSILSDSRFKEER